MCTKHNRKYLLKHFRAQQIAATRSLTDRTFIVILKKINYTLFLYSFAPAFTTACHLTSKRCFNTQLKSPTNSALLLLSCTPYRGKSNNRLDINCTFQVRLENVTDVFSHSQYVLD